MNSTDISPPRIRSIDQFRGYSVAAMFVVNFLGGLAVTHHVLKHNNTHFSYADSIMPSFIFICGYSYRMSFCKRAKSGSNADNGHLRFILRSLGLILLSVMLFGFNTKISNWSEWTSARLLKFLLELIKADLWEVLAIIGALQLLLLPFISRTVWYRIILLLAFGIIHFGLCVAFNYDFVYGRTNWLDSILVLVEKKRAWDGGCFGLLAWGQIMLAGTIAYDMSTAVRTGKTAVWRYVALGTLAMIFGYALSCITRLYDLDGLSDEEKAKVVASPVLPDWNRIKDRPLTDLMAEPPFVPPPGTKIRAINYWMMDKRIVTQSFVWFSLGFALVLYGLFVLVCDRWGGGLRLFEIFGKNPLAAYIINHMVNHSILNILPKNSPLAPTILGLVVAFGVTYLFVWFLDQRKLYLRL